jgi:protein-S-isoprenylcysteine O-methyltransferase Ste14
MGQESPVVAVLTTLMITLITYYLYFCVAFNGGAVLPGGQADWRGFFAAIVPTFAAGAVYLAWLALQLVLCLVLPGREVEGLPLEDGSRLRYRLNGLAALAATVALLGVGQGFGWISLGWIPAHFGALLSSVTLFSFAFSLFLYWWGRTRPGGPSRVSGNFLVDYFFGTALNPRVPPVTGLDLKFFFESRPGLIGWLVVIAGFAVSQWERHGTISLSMALVVCLQAAYIGKYFWSEHNVLSMIDIRTERFGWMLAYGDAALVPMTYSLQAFYLVDHVPTIPVWVAGITLVLSFAGFYIFSSANAQKDRFRRDPQNCRIWGKPAEFITTQRGTPLLVSGFWGLSRHMNYFGDWLIAVSWSLPTLFGSALPYFYPAWMAMLLLSRERRDDRWCEEKYGADWERYRKRVPSRIVPGIY